MSLVFPRAQTLNKEVLGSGRHSRFCFPWSSNPLPSCICLPVPFPLLDFVTLRASAEVTRRRQVRPTASSFQEAPDAGTGVILTPLQVEDNIRSFCTPHVSQRPRSACLCAPLQTRTRQPAKCCFLHNFQFTKHSSSSESSRSRFRRPQLSSSPLQLPRCLPLPAHSTSRENSCTIAPLLPKPCPLSSRAPASCYLLPC